MSEAGEQGNTEGHQTGHEPHRHQQRQRHEHEGQHGGHGDDAEGDSTLGDDVLDGHPSDRRAGLEGNIGVAVGLPRRRVRLTGIALLVGAALLAVGLLLVRNQPGVRLRQDGILALHGSPPWWWQTTTRVQ